MYFYLIGIDHKTADVSIRSALYRGRKEIEDFWGRVAYGGTALLFTCNRIEIYGVVKEAEDVFYYFDEFGRQFPDFLRRAYIKYGRRDILSHASRLASGLESQLKGERQILNQLDSWLSNEGFPSALKELWQEALLLSEGARLSSGTGNSSHNIAGVVFDDIGRSIRSGRALEITVVGTGKIAEIISQYPVKPARINFAAHKNFRKAVLLAKGSGGEAVNLAELPRLLAATDVLISATLSPHYVIKAKDVSAAAVGRAAPLYIYDLAMPLDVEPDVSGIKGIILKNTDDLKDAFERHNNLIDA
ncbi:MAG: hypothetical protein PHR44_03250 [Candidatus Omnitrophica bacterium]|nr:hypothetical protein [Candidatus Omnitrophota bacterium]